MTDLPAIIFDLDGTLIDSAPDIHATALRILAAEGLSPLGFATVKGFIGAGVGPLISRILAAQNLPAEGPQHQRMVADFVKIYEEAVDLTSLYPGALTLVEQLAARGFPLAICTNKPSAPTRAVLRHFGLLAHFPVIVGGDTLAVRKPDPAPLRAAWAQTGASRVLFVGDSEVDAETARATALPFALFTGGYRKTPADQLGATVVFDHHGDLPGHIDRLFPTS